MVPAMELVARAVRAAGRALDRRRSRHLFTGSGPETLGAQPRISGRIAETGDFGGPSDSDLILRPSRTLGKPGQYAPRKRAPR